MVHMPAWKREYTATIVMQMQSTWWKRAEYRKAIALCRLTQQFFILIQKIFQQHLFAFF